MAQLEGFKLRLGAMGSLIVTDIDGDEAYISPGNIKAFCDAVAEMRDELFPPEPGSLDIPDPAPYEAARARVEAIQAEPFSPNEARGAVGRLALVVGDIITPGRLAS